MTIKQLIDNYGGVREFRRMLKKKKKLYGKPPSDSTVYNHYKVGKITSLRLKDMYRDLGVTEF